MVIAVHAALRHSLVEGEFAFDAADFRTIADIVKSVAGIDLPDSKATLVYSRLSKRLRERKLVNFSDYCKLVQSDAEELNRMIAAITTNVTKFFREAHHFEHLKKNVVESMSLHLRKGERLRIWSAACSTGQEPYSIALSILEQLPDAPKWDIRVLATDINRDVIEHGRKGLYQLDEIASVPAGLRTRYFQAVSGGVQVSEEVKKLVTFRQLNLMEPWPMRGKFNAIFCRNVVIYFDRPTQDRLWRRLADNLEPGGSLYIGHSEHISDTNLGPLKQDGITTYVLNRRGHE